ncbi:hypothetical protein [Streptomyces sp. NPDC101178]|uniref:hypothetical protein n=1 Tax=Streptomyces sp. NPDC101178 TaxID=3366124 RepID=UPI0037F7F40F
MSGATEEARTESGRAGAVGMVLGVLAAAALAGFLVGAILGDGRADVSQGLTLAVVLVLLAAFVVALAWWQTRRRAARLGIGTARYIGVVRRIRRGEIPEDPAELPAAIDAATRARRSLDLQDSRLAWWLLGGLALLWFVTGLLKALDGHYVRAGYNLVLAGLLLANPLTMRRQRRRLEAVERALRDRGHLLGPSDGTEAPAGRTPAGPGRQGGGRPEGAAAPDLPGSEPK